MTLETHNQTSKQFAIDLYNIETKESFIVEGMKRQGNNASSNLTFTWEMLKLANSSDPCFTILAMNKSSDVQWDRYEIFQDDLHADMYMGKYSEDVLVDNNGDIVKLTPNGMLESTVQMISKNGRTKVCSGNVPLAIGICLRGKGTDKPKWFGIRCVLGPNDAVGSIAQRFMAVGTRYQPKYDAKSIIAGKPVKGHLTPYHIELGRLIGKTPQRGQTNQAKILSTKLDNFFRKPGGTKQRPNDEPMTSEQSKKLHVVSTVAQSLASNVSWIFSMINTFYYLNISL